jgi:hypothetical protein
MTLDDVDSSPHPGPHAVPARRRESWFGLFGGPVAWFAQTCAGTVLASEACYRDGTGAMVPPPHLQWTWPAMILLTAAAVVVALLSVIVSWRALERIRVLAQGDDSGVLIDLAARRTQFLALWGMIFGVGFAIATAFNAFALFTLPQCAG